MAWNNKRVLVKETQHCKACGQSTEHWKVKLKIGGASKVMTYTGGVMIPILFGMTNKMFPWQCSICNPLRRGVKVKGWGKSAFKGEWVDRLIRDGEV